MARDIESSLSMRTPATFVLVLHGHLPDVLGHGTWPHGANWLYEAAAETYVPFLRAAESRRWIKPSWYWTGIDAGFEIWRGGQGLGVRYFNVNS